MIIQYNDLQSIRKQFEDKKIVFCSGSFDLLHAGHVLFFEDCKKYGDVLVVAIGDDTILRIKGPDRPIQNQHIRIKMVDSIKAVDYCFIHKNVEGPFLNTFMDEVLSLLKPDVWVVNGDASEIPYREELAKKHATTFHILDRECPPEFEGISTSSIIKKIRSGITVM